MSTATKQFAIINMCFLTLLLSGCFFGFIGDVRRDFGKYNGDYPELYSVAINSVLGARGYQPDGHGPFQSEVVPIEKDSLGRTMFLYYEGNKISTHSLIISQKNDGEYVYYYPDNNFISTFRSIKLYQAAFDTSYYNIYGLDAKSPIDIISEKFKDEEIQKLKKKNDWNMKIDIDKCEKVKIVRQKEKKGPIWNWTVEEFYRRISYDDGYSHIYINFFAKDNYNRSIYVVNGGKTDGRRTVVLFFQPDGSYDEENGFMELNDLNNYQDDLKAFKERNKWNVKP